MCFCMLRAFMLQRQVSGPLHPLPLVESPLCPRGSVGREIKTIHSFVVSALRFPEGFLPSSVHQDACESTAPLIEFYVMTYLRSRIINVQLYGQSLTACEHRMANRKWKETKQHPGTAGPGNMLGCCLVSFHFLWGIILCAALSDDT